MIRDVTVLTGFLGAGKTTLLNSLLRLRDFSQTLTLVNEFGEVGIDHQLLPSMADTPPYQLNGGCICCFQSLDWLDRLTHIAGAAKRGASPDFTRVIVETSGLTMPQQIIQTLLRSDEFARRYRLAGVVTVLEVSTAECVLTTYREAIEQVRAADVVVLSKCDKLLENTRSSVVESAKHVIAAINPLARLVRSEPVPEVGDLLKAGPDADVSAPYEIKAAPEHTSAAYRSLWLVADSSLPYARVSGFLDAASARFGRDLLRVKGFVHDEAHPDRPHIVQGALGQFDQPVTLPQWPDSEHSTSLVAIVRAGHYEDLLALWLAHAKTDAPDADFSP